jgi:UDP-N-acetylglucosamine--N-acetylmuramyl-(pentapeptide) pyrophosphoryl-undecaprenol N-acetylglucosamine transferase
MNEIMAEFIAKNAAEHAFRHIHASGGGAEGREALAAKAAPEHDLPEWEDVRAYIDDMPRLMAAADLVLCRAGASTLAELAVSGRAALLVPSPFVTNDHQTANANAMCALGGAVMLPERECTGARLFEEVSALLRDSERRLGMEARQRELGARDASERLASEIISML